MLGHLAPRLTDAYMERAMFEPQKTFDRRQPGEGSLEQPLRDGRAWGPHQGHTMRSTADAKAALSDVARAIPYVAAGVALMAGVRRWRSAA